MIEFIATFMFVVAGLNIAADIGSKAYDYAEPKVQQGVEYIEEKLN
jgi:hypothetical protein